MQIDWFKGKVKVANQLILSVNGPGLVEMRYFRLQKRTMDMSLLIYQCLQTDAKIVKTVDKLDVNCARENIFGGLSRNVWKEEWRTNWKAILAKDIQEEFILIFTYFLSIADFMFFFKVESCDSNLGKLLISLSILEKKRFQWWFKLMLRNRHS